VTPALYAIFQITAVKKFLTANCDISIMMYDRRGGSEVSVPQTRSAGADGPVGGRVSQFLCDTRYGAFRCTCMFKLPLCQCI